MIVKYLLLENLLMSFTSSFYTCLAGVEVNDNTTGNQYCSFNLVKYILSKM